MAGRAALAGLVALLLAVPALTAQHPYVLHVLILSCVYAIPAVGLNLMLGYTGLVSLGHMAFAGVRAYTAAVLMVAARLGFWLSLPLGVLAAAAARAAVGALCLRFRTHCFMIVTWASGLPVRSACSPVPRRARRSARSACAFARFSS